MSSAVPLKVECREERVQIRHLPEETGITVRVSSLWERTTCVPGWERTTCVPHNACSYELALCNRPNKAASERIPMTLDAVFSLEDVGGS